MSRKSEREFVGWGVDDGARVEELFQKRKAPPSLGSIPAKDRVADIYSPSGEWLATCTGLRSADGGLGALGVIYAGSSTLAPSVLVLPTGEVHGAMGGPGSFRPIGASLGDNLPLPLFATTPRWRVATAELLRHAARATRSRPVRVVAVVC